MRGRLIKPLLSLPFFFSANSPNVGISTQSILNFNFNPFVTLLESYRVKTSTSPKLSNLNQDHPSKNEKTRFSSQILIKLKLRYDNFFHRKARVTNFWSRDHTYNVIIAAWQSPIDDVKDTNYDVMIFFSKYLYFKEVWSSQLCWHHQNFNNVNRINL